MGCGASKVAENQGPFTPLLARPQDLPEKKEGEKVDPVLVCEGEKVARVLKELEKRRSTIQIVTFKSIRLDEQEELLFKVCELPDLRRIKLLNSGLSEASLKKIAEVAKKGTLQEITLVANSCFMPDKEGVGQFMGLEWLRIFMTKEIDTGPLKVNGIEVSKEAREKQLQDLKNAGLA